MSEKHAFYTPEILLQIAAEAEEKYNALLIQFPAGTLHDERNDARRTMEKALACAAWLDRNGHKQLAHVGPFHAFKPVNGERVCVKAGSVIYSTKPGTPREGVASVRDQIVSVHYADQGYVDDQGYKGNKDDVRQGQITWAGAGGYWRRTDLNNVSQIAHLEADSMPKKSRLKP